MATTPEKILDLIKEDTNGGIQDLDNDTLKGFVKNLATFMAKENKSLNEGFLGHLPIHESDYPGEDGFSLYEFFDNRIDLDGVNEEINDSDEVKNRDNFIQYIIRSLQNQSEQILWNKSMDQILKEYIDYCDKDFKIEGSTQPEHEYTVDDIRHANAGRNFADGPEWVRPEKDNMGELYQNVRGNDKIDQVLKSKKNLQFTRQDKINDTILNYYIRLIMPKYTRRVEVEDLNRNFWVIGQALSAVAAALFDDNGPIKKFMKYSLSEILQLWENVIYLWASVRLLNEKKSEVEPEESVYPIHYEVIDCPRAYDKPYRDINNFIDVPDFSKADWYKPFRGIAHNYPEHCLCLLIRCRFGNYEKDYYHTEVYPYIVYYNRYKKGEANKWSYTRLNIAGSGKGFLGFTLRADSDITNSGLYNYLNLRPYVYAIREAEPNNYYNYFPFNDLPPKKYYKTPGSGYWTNQPKEQTSNEPGHYYYSIVRIKPTLYATVDENQNIKVTTLKFVVEDIARRLHYFGTDILPYNAQSIDYNNYDKPAQDQFVDDRKNHGTLEAEQYTMFYEHNEIVYVANSEGKNINENISTVTLEQNPLGSAISKSFTYKGHSYNLDNIFSSDGAYPTGFTVTVNDRDSGFQGSLCDMLTYRGRSLGANETQPVDPS